MQQVCAQGNPLALRAAIVAGCYDSYESSDFCAKAGPGSRTGLR